MVVMWLLSGTPPPPRLSLHLSFPTIAILCTHLPTIRAWDVYLSKYYGRVMLFSSRRGTQPELPPGALRARSKPISRRRPPGEDFLPPR